MPSTTRQALLQALSAAGVPISPASSWPDSWA